MRGEEAGGVMGDALDIAIESVCDDMLDVATGGRMKILAVDFSSVYWTAYHATADEVMSAAFDRTVSRIRDQARGYDRTVIACDAPPLLRKKTYDLYKAQRDVKPREAVEMMKRAREALRADGYAIVKVDGHEADDVLATVARWALANGHQCDMFAVDKDLFSCLSGDDVRMINHSNGVVRDEAWLLDEKGIRPDQVADWLALQGDKADNLPGVDKCGEKKAAQLLGLYGTLAGIYDAVHNRAVEFLSHPGIGKALAASLRDAELGEVTIHDIRQLTELRSDLPIDFDAIVREQAPATIDRPVNQTQVKRAMAAAAERPREEPRALAAPPSPKSEPRRVQPAPQPQRKQENTMGFNIRKASTKQARARIAIYGPSGCGKTWSALSIMTSLCDRVVLIDTENASSEKYAKDFNFDVLPLESFSPLTYAEAIRYCEAQGYDGIVVDSLSHAWVGKDGALEQVDKAAARAKGNSYVGWRDVTPMHNELVDSLVRCGSHLLVTMRAKTEYVLEEDHRGKKVPKRIGMAPVQRDGLEYEFDVVGDMDLDHKLIITKTRCRSLDGEVILKPDHKLAKVIKDWLDDGVNYDAQAKALMGEIDSADTLGVLANIAERVKVANLPREQRDKVGQRYKERREALRGGATSQPEAPAAK
jgi:5'-3' exonuclease